MSQGSETYRHAEQDMGVPPVSERGRRNMNPSDIGFWALVAEDFRTHERKLFEQGFWAIFVHRFGNWRMGQPKIIRAPATLLYRILFKLIEWICGISLWYTVKLGRRVRIWHHSGMSLGARAIGDDVHIRQNTTLGVAQTGVNDALPIIGDRADIGAGAVIAGAVYIGRDSKIGANALVLADVPDGATAIGNPAQILSVPPSDAARPATIQATVAPVAADTSSASPREESPLSRPRDLGRIALLGSANLDYLAMAFRDSAARLGLVIEPQVPPFGQARMELLKDPGDSELQQAMADGPAATLIVERAEDVLGEAYLAPLGLPPEDRDEFLDAALNPMLQLLHDARAKLTGPVIVTTLSRLTRSTLGVADAISDRGLDDLLARANAKLAAAVGELQDVHLLDMAQLLSEGGREQADPGSFWHLGRVPYSQPFQERMARQVFGTLLALRGQTARILVLDLDNTLWGGVLGEDGIEGLEIGGGYPGSAYRRFQEAILALSQRGIALAVASKNDEDLAMRMIAEHPEMAIRPDDIAIHRIGWDEKSHGIQDMLDEIGLGAANAMFIDDNPVERQKVRENIPEMIVPHFPAAPEDLVGWLLDSPFLQALELTGSDLKRSAQYRTRAKVNAARRDFRNVEDFLRDLDMHLVFEPYGPNNQKRVLQLFAKTNQFNATQRRHDAGAIERILAEGGGVFAIGVSDRHSGYELMGVAVLRDDASIKAAYPDDKSVQSQSGAGIWWVDSLLLSCRILGRTVEHAIVGWLTQEAARRGAGALIGEIIESPRNTPVRGVYAKAGMQRIDTAPEMGAGGLYRCDLTTDGPIALPDYFSVDDAPPAGAAEVTPDAAPARPRLPDGSAISTIPAGQRQPITAPVAPVISAVLDAATETRLAAAFRQVFGLSADSDINAASMDNLPGWDSLAHLRLAMEVERSLGRKLPGEALSRIRSYSDLRAALA